MSTILVCATPLAGHVGPLTAVGRVLADRGHEVIMLTGSRFADRVGDAGLTVESLTGVADLDERDPDSFTPDRHRYRGLALSRYQVERTFIAPLPEQAAAVASVVGRRGVDVILCDGTFAGIIPLLSRPPGRRPPVIGVGTMPLAQSSPDVAPFNSGLPPMSGRLGRLRNRLAHMAVRRVLFASTQSSARDLVRRAGGSLDHFVLDLSRAFDRFVQLGPAEFEYPRSDLAPNTVFAGPVFPGGAVPPPPWWSEMVDDDRPIVHVTQGTLDNDDFSQLIEPAVAGLAEMDVQVVVTTGGADPDPVPRNDNTRVARFLDYDALLPRTSVLITNGGYGGVLQALRHGVPVVVAPGGEDKPEVAARVAYFGVGADLGTRRPAPADLAATVRRILADDGVAVRCRQMAHAIAGYDSTQTIVTEVDRAVRRSTRSS